MLIYHLLIFAQRIPAGQVGVEELDADTVLANTLNLVYFAAGAAAVVTLIAGAIMYSSSGGNASSITKAKGLITYSIIGLIVVVAAFMITNFVRGIF